MDEERGRRTAIVFPGMGPTAFGDVARFMLVNPFATGLVAEADEVLGYRLTDRYRQADSDYSVPGQVSFVVNCLALAQWAGARAEARPEFVVGPSFGGRAAAVYAGTLTFADAVRMTARLAEVMDDWFAREQPDLVTQSMARLPEDRMTVLRRELDEQGEWHDLSCQVDHDFTMLTVREQVQDWLQQRIRALGGMPLYTMKPPMHSYVLKPLRDLVAREVFADLAWSDPRIPLVADQDGRLVTTGEQVREMLLDGFVRPVRWPQAVSALREAGVGRLYVAGQDGLFTRVPCTTRAFEVVAVTPASVMRPVRRGMPEPTASSGV